MPTSLTELFSPACHLCPRRCGAARDEGARGVCGADNTLKVARAAASYVGGAAYLGRGRLGHDFL